MVFQCPDCGKDFTAVKPYTFHFTRAHQTCDTYVCPVNDCARQYNVLNSLENHLSSFHEIPQQLIDPVPIVINIPVNTGPEAAQRDEDVESVASVDCGHNVELNVECVANINYREQLKKQEDIFIAKLYANPAFPRNIVDKIILDISNYLNSPFFENMKEVVTSSLNPDLTFEIRKDINGMFECLKEPFSHLKTEHIRFQYFENCGNFIHPETYVIDSREERVMTKTGVSLAMKDVTGQFIPLRRLFTKFFELPDALSDSLSYMRSIENRDDWYFNFIQGEVWKRKRARYGADDIVIPVNVYFDECQPNQDLGPHCELLGCTYVHIPVLPPEWNSRLENIFLALLFDAENRSLYGNFRVFKPLLEELLFLETEGIEVEVLQFGNIRIYLVLGVILGDNKGLNEICGFMEGFTANFYCRICFLHKQVCKRLFVEDIASLRTPVSYADDVLRQDPQATGVKEKCIFGLLPSFEAPTDISVDEFHDLIEGISHYSLIPILKHFHTQNDMFLITLNNRLYAAHYGVDNDNRPGLINEDRFTTDKLKMTGAEMYTFVRYFGVFVKDLVPNQDPFYKLYLLLHDIMSIVHAKGLPKEAKTILKVKVKEHHELYVKLTGETLKPKHHNFLHYPRLLDLFGPTANLSTIRFEAKHRLLKQTANTCISRVNLSKTVAIKQQLNFCFRSLSNQSIRQPIEVGSTSQVDLRRSNMWPTFSGTLPNSVFNNPIRASANLVEYKGTTYQPKQVLVTNINDIGLFVFSEVKLILIHEDAPLFICEPFETISYMSEVRGYEVQKVRNAGWCSVTHGNLVDPYPLQVMRTGEGEDVIVLRYLL